MSYDNNTKKLYTTVESQYVHTMKRDEFLSEFGYELFKTQAARHPYLVAYDRTVRHITNESVYFTKNGVKEQHAKGRFIKPLLDRGLHLSRYQLTERDTSSSILDADFFTNRVNKLGPITRVSASLKRQPSANGRHPVVFPTIDIEKEYLNSTVNVNSVTDYLDRLKVTGYQNKTITQNVARTRHYSLLPLPSSLNDNIDINVIFITPSDISTRNIVIDDTTIPNKNNPTFILLLDLDVVSSPTPMDIYDRYTVKRYSILKSVNFLNDSQIPVDKNSFISLHRVVVNTSNEVVVLIGGTMHFTSNMRGGPSGFGCHINSLVHVGPKQTGSVYLMQVATVNYSMNALTYQKNGVYNGIKDTAGRNRINSRLKTDSESLVNTVIEHDKGYFKRMVNNAIISIDSDVSEDTAVYVYLPTIPGFKEKLIDNSTEGFIPETTPINSTFGYLPYIEYNHILYREFSIRPWNDSVSFQYASGLQVYTAVNAERMVQLPENHPTYRTRDNEDFYVIMDAKTNQIKSIHMGVNLQNDWHRLVQAHYRYYLNEFPINQEWYRDICCMTFQEDLNLAVGNRKGYRIATSTINNRHSLIARSPRRSEYNKLPRFYE